MAARPSGAEKYFFQKGSDIIFQINPLPAVRITDLADTFSADESIPRCRSPALCFLYRQSQSCFSPLFAYFITDVPRKRSFWGRAVTVFSGLFSRFSAPEGMSCFFIAGIVYPYTVKLWMILLKGRYRSCFEKKRRRSLLHQ